MAVRLLAMEWADERRVTERMEQFPVCYPNRRTALLSMMPHEAENLMNPWHLGINDPGDGFQYGGEVAREINPHLWTWDGQRWHYPTAPGSTIHAMMVCR